MWEQLYRLWIAHGDHLRRELGQAAAEAMLREAHQVLPTLPGRRAVLLTLRRLPGTSDRPGAAARMAGPGSHLAGRPASTERTPQ